jgi:hypothetical protein
MQKSDRSAPGKVLQLIGITVEVIDIAIRAVVILILSERGKFAARIPAITVYAIESIRNRVSEQVECTHCPQLSVALTGSIARLFPTPWEMQMVGEFITRESAIRD